MKTRSKIAWTVEEWFDRNIVFEKRRSSAKLFGVGINDIDVKVKPKDVISNPVYTKWQRMLERSYCPKYKSKFPTYTDVRVCERWLTFSHFRCDYLKLINGVEERKSFILDKDLIVKGNKIYSPEACCLLPTKINSFLTSCNTKRGSLPRGVSKRSRGHKFMVTLSCGGLNKNLGNYSTPEEAFQVYKKAKESASKVLALEYEKLLLPNEFSALNNISVEITD